jgi:hypothetical protein
MYTRKLKMGILGIEPPLINTVRCLRIMNRINLGWLLPVIPMEIGIELPVIDTVDRSNHVWRLPVTWTEMGIELTLALFGMLPVIPIEVWIELAMAMIWMLPVIPIEVWIELAMIGNV